MAFFSFSFIDETLTYLSEQTEINQKYYSKDIDLWKELNNRNKKKKNCIIKYEKRLKIKDIGKRLLICLPPKFGLGDAIEYSIAIKSLLKSNKFNKIGIAFCKNHIYIFKTLFKFSNIYPLFISNEEIQKYDTIFHITLEIKALKFQKYKRSNIVDEICKHFQLPIISFKIKNKTINNSAKTISIFPVSTSTIRSLPYKVIEQIIKNFQDDYKIKIFIDDSLFSKYLENKNFTKNIIFVKPKNIESLTFEISKINFGVFVDSGPLHLAKIFDKKGILVETSVSSKVVLVNSNNIEAVSNQYSSNYCQGPCGLTDIFLYNKNVGCYETNKLFFEDIKYLKNYKNLQRWNKKEINSQFFLNPVGCVKKINVKNIIELIKVKIKEDR